MRSAGAEEAAERAKKSEKEKAKTLRKKTPTKGRRKKISFFFSLYYYPFFYWQTTTKKMTIIKKNSRFTIITMTCVFQQVFTVQREEVIDEIRLSLLVFCLCECKKPVVVVHDTSYIMYYYNNVT